MKKPSQNLKAIKNVKGKLESVNVTEVAKELKWSRQNIYYHLDENKSESVNLDILNQISAAIDKVKQKKEKADKTKLASLI